MIISITGNPGSGKTTVANILSKKLRLKQYYIGGILRNLAREKNLTIQEYLGLANKNPKIDKEVDLYQEKLGKTKDNFIIQGRTSYHFIPHSYKIYLLADEKTAAKRIFQDIKKNNKKRNEGCPKNVAEVLKSIRERKKWEAYRYKKYYGINPNNKKNYDLIIDTTNISPDEVVKTIIKNIKQK